MSIRTEKVASLIKEEIGQIFTRDFNDGSIGFLTVTDVRVTPDLRIAKVYVSILGSPEVRSRSLKMLEEQTPAIRHTVASRIRIKFIPEIHFYLDETMDRVERIETLIKQIHRNDR